MRTDCRRKGWSKYVIDSKNTDKSKRMTGKSLQAGRQANQDFRNLQEENNW